MKSLNPHVAKVAPFAMNLILGSRVLRTQAAKIARKYMYRMIVDDDTRYTHNIRYERYIIASNLLLSLENALSNRRVSPSVRKKLVNTFFGRVFLKNAKRNQDDFIREYGQDPPGFIVISPGKRCNLRCTGCYAASAAKSTEKLDYATVDRIVREESNLWNAFFTVISGGEPLMWKSDGKGVLDLCREHPENYFLMYTNGTLITREMAEQIAEVGNLSPAISVEGFAEETDERRGAGVFSKILRAMANLREVGVPFGISVTATRNNVETVVSDEFIKFFFEDQGAIYGWIFQYMPIGRHHTLDLMVTPEQRKWMFDHEKHIIHDRHIFLPDFWNGGAFAEGCLAGGRAGGYVHIEWNGNVTPCVFYPYSKDNIKDIYATGGNLNTVLKSDLMTGIRAWQRDYGFGKSGKEVKNLIAPCSIRDHYAFTHEHLKRTKAAPIDSDSAEAVKDPLYYKGMVEYNRQFSALTDPVWQREFIDGGGGAVSPDGEQRVVEPEHHLVTASSRSPKTKEHVAARG